MEKKFRLHRIIRRLMNEGMTTHGLARRINEINSHYSPRVKISRHTISRLAKEPLKASVTYENLIALDRYLEQMGEGLADKPILEKDELLARLLENNKFAFLVGSKPNKDQLHDDVSLWDFRTVIELGQQLDAINTDWHHELVDVFLSGEGRLEYYGRSWYETIVQQSRSIVAIGAPRANLASEVMLARMFGLEPFNPPQSPDGNRAPFYFFWPAKSPDKAVASSFAPNPAEIRKSAPREYANWISAGADALWFDGRWHDSIKRTNGWFKYGILAAQRRKDQSIWLVLAGVSGPATLAVARLLKEVKHEIPNFNDPGSPVLWAVVKVPLHEEHKEGDRRAIGNPEFICQPQIWRRK